MDRPIRTRRAPVQADGTVFPSILDALRTPTQRQQTNARAPSQLQDNDANNTPHLPAQLAQPDRGRALDIAPRTIRLESPSPLRAPGASQLHQDQVSHMRGPLNAPAFGGELHGPTVPETASSPQLRSQDRRRARGRPRGRGRTQGRGQRGGRNSSDGEFPHLSEIGAEDSSSDDGPRRRPHPTSNPPSEPNSRPVSRPSSAAASRPPSNPPSQPNSRSASIDPLAARSNQKAKTGQDVDYFFVRGSRRMETKSVCKLCR